jgi:hypothetical protein
MSVFDLPHAHMPPSHESHPSNGMWEFLSTLWNPGGDAPVADPSYRVDVVGPSCVIVSKDGKESVLF